MPYKNKADRSYKRDWQMEKARGEKALKTKLARQRARRQFDKEGIDRDGMDIDHKVPASKGGTNAKSNLRLRTPSQNRSFDRNADHSVRKNEPLKKGKAKK